MSSFRKCGEKKKGSITSYSDQLCFDLNDGNKMPAIGYGTWQALDEDLEKALNIALEVGYRHIDTAAVYCNEHVIGKVLEEWFTSRKLKREDIYIVTKLPNIALKANAVERTLKKSLEKLKLDYVDMYLIHVPFGSEEVEGEYFPKDENGKFRFINTVEHISLWKAMESQVDAGRTKSIGISNFNERQIQRILDNARIPPANLQIELHLFMQQNSLVELCKKNNIVVTSYSSLGTPGTIKNMGKQIPGVLDNPVVIEMAKKYGKSPAQIALRFIIQKDIVVIPKSISEKRIRENFQITDFQIEDNDMNKLQTLDKGEDGRLIIFNEFFPGCEDLDEYPFPKRGVPVDSRNTL